MWKCWKEVLDGIQILLLTKLECGSPPLYMHSRFDDEEEGRI